MSNTPAIPDFEKFAQEVKQKILVVAQVEGQRFIQSNFDRQGFTDAIFEPWPLRNPNLDVGRPVLRDTSNLRGSITSNKNQAKLEVTFVSDVIYADIHNKGGAFTVSAGMKKFFWAKFYQSGGKGVKESQLNPVQRFYKNMALLKAGTKITIPKRQFMGDSAFFADKLADDIATLIAGEFNNIGSI